MNEELYVKQRLIDLKSTKSMTELYDDIEKLEKLYKDIPQILQLLRKWKEPLNLIDRLV